MNEDIKSQIKDIIEIVEGIPEKFQEIAFSQLLKRELSIRASSPDYELEAKKDHKETLTSQLGSDYQDWEKEVLNGLPEPHIIAENDNRDQQAVWAVSKLYEKGEEATTGKVRSVIRDQLGLTPQNNSNTARTLRNLVPKYLRREKDGKTYKYFPIRNSIKIFSSNDDS